MSGIIKFSKLTVDGVDKIGARFIFSGLQPSVLPTDGVSVGRQVVDANKKWQGKCLLIRGDQPDSYDRSDNTARLFFYIDSVEVFETSVNMPTGWGTGSSGIGWDEDKPISCNSQLFNFNDGIVIPSGIEFKITVKKWLLGTLTSMDKKYVVAVLSGRVGANRTLVKQTFIGVVSSDTAEETVLSYTPSSDFTLLGISIDYTTPGAMTGLGHLSIGGNPVFEAPYLGLEHSSSNALDDKGHSGWGMGGIAIPLWGMDFYPGDNFDFLAHAPEIGNQIFTLNVFANEVDMGGGTTYNDSVYESGSISDSLSVLAIFISSINEASSLIDSLSVLALFISSINETSTLIDSPTNIANILSSASESSSLIDNQNSTRTFLSSISESSALLDSLSSIMTIIAGIIESGSINDLEDSGGPSTSICNEVATLIDSAQSVLIAIATRIESGTLVDSEGANFTYLGTINESGSISDIVSAISNILCTLNESSSINEIQIALSNIVVDTIEIGDLIDLYEIIYERISVLITGEIIESEYTMNIIKMTLSGFIEQKNINGEIHNRKRTSGNVIKQDIKGDVKLH